MNKQYCIFDLDGTLVDSMEYWRPLERNYLRGKGVPDHLIEAATHRTQHMTVAGAAECYAEMFGLPGTPLSIAEELNAIMAGHYTHDVKPKPGVLAYLDKLRAAGVRMCIASATGAPLVRLCAETLGLDRYLDFILSCEEVGAGKERPDVFLEAARRMGAAPEECAVFEDSLTAVTTAKAAGFYTVGIYDTCSAHSWPAMKALAHETIADWQEPA